MKAVCQKAIECANRSGDKRFKALFKATESALSAVETGAFDFKYDPVKAGTAYFKESPCQERKAIIEESKKLIIDFLMEVKKKQKKQEISCLAYIAQFLEKFEAKKMYTYTSALNQLVIMVESVEKNPAGVS
jgi:hypothetical protein